MRFPTRIVCLLVALPAADAFSFTGKPLAGPSNTQTTTMEYIPSGMSKEQWRKVKEAEKNKTKGKNLGKTGITTFQSRSFAEWQKSGGLNLFPVDPTKVKDPSEIPYMQRPGGKPDNSDLKKGAPFSFSFGAKKKVEVKEEEEPPKKNWWTLN